MKSSPLWKVVKDGLDRLADELAKGHTEAFLNFLRTMAQFHRYSPHNTMLIWVQRPDATLVAGIRTWNRLGRWVRKGEKGIHILAPVLKKVVETGEDGQEVEVEKVVGFRGAVVFDIAQTEGKPLPQGPTNRGPEDLYPRLLEACPYPVREVPLGNRYGDTNGRVIRINQDLPPAEKAATLLHEWAHVLLHYGEDKGKLPVQVKELEAEVVAYATGSYLGLEMVASRDYILHWAGQEAQGVLGALLPRVAQAVGNILGRLEKGNPFKEAEAL